MGLSYKSNKLKKQLTEPKHRAKAFGQLARRIDQRLEELKAIDTLEGMRAIPGARCHEFSGKRKGQLAVEVSGHYRLIF